MLESMKWRAIALARRGFSAKGIAKEVRRYDGAEYNPSAFYPVLKAAGVRIKDYRDIESKEARAVVRDLFPGDRPATKIIRRLGGPPLVEPKPKRKEKPKVKWAKRKAQRRRKSKEVS